MDVTTFTDKLWEHPGAYIRLTGGNGIRPDFTPDGRYLSATAHNATDLGQCSVSVVYSEHGSRADDVADVTEAAFRALPPTRVPGRFVYPLPDQVQMWAFRAVEYDYAQWFIRDLVFDGSEFVATVTDW